MPRLMHSTKCARQSGDRADGLFEHLYYSVPDAEGPQDADTTSLSSSLTHLHSSQNTAERARPSERWHSAIRLQSQVPAPSTTTQKHKWGLVLRRKVCCSMASLLADFGIKLLPSRSVNRVDLLRGYTKAPYLKGTPTRCHRGPYPYSQHYQNIY